MIIYTIINKTTKKPLGISIFSNDGGDFCNECGAGFEENCDNLFAVLEKGIAENALLSDPKWYNASLSRPMWFVGFNPSHYEVFPLTLR